MIPRPVVVLVVLVLLAILSADVGAQFVVPGHTASPVIDGAIIALIGAIITGTRGPKPEAPPNLEAATPAPTAPQPPVAETAPRPGRHHYRAEDWP